MTAGYRIRELHEADREGWQRLYAGYADFYHNPLTPERTETTFGWLMDPAHVLCGLVAEADDGALVALAHFRDMPSPLRGATVGFLDDLYADPEWRGAGVAAALIRAIEVIGRERGWPLFRWITREDNFRARGLYERVAQRTDWVTYEHAVGPAGGN